MNAVTAPDTHARGIAGGVRGVFGRPFVTLDDLFDLSGLDAIHDEVCLALAQMPVSYTGGSHRSMGIMPPGLEQEALVDYQEVIRDLDEVGFATFRSLADDPDAMPPGRNRDVQYGEERDVPLSNRQMLWLKMRHRVYFPWKVYAELIPNLRWEDKSNPEGKRFTRQARTFLPKTIEFVKSLPFSHIGRCNIMGLEANDHGTLHRDGEPAEQGEPDHFLTVSPVPGKRLYIFDPETGERTTVEGRVIWFNDFDYHGVFADPYFRYSIRVDGVFTPEFRQALVERYRRQP